MKLFTPSRLFALIILLLPFSSGYTQTRVSGSVKGIVTDSTSLQPLEFVSVAIKNLADSFVVQTTATGKEGKFQLTGIPVGNYELWLSYIGYQTRKIPFDITGKRKDVDIGNILYTEGLSLNEVIIEGESAPIVVKRDTVEYNVASFKTQPNDNVEELLKKLPGVEVDRDGKITAQGKPVNKILVDGKEFFGGDPKAATKNLPADAIKKIQLIDDKTENSKNTGIDDGEREKVINLTVKEDMKKGWFGNAALAGGSAERYLGQLNMNQFKKDKQLSVLLMSNNINQSGFSLDDLLSFSNRDFSGVFGSADGSLTINSSRNGSGDINGIFSGVGQGGLINTHSGGINFVNSYGKNKQLRLNGSYVAILSSSTVSRVSDIRDPLAGELISTSQSAYNENESNIHRLNFGIEYKPDTLTRLNFKPNFSLSQKSTLNDQNFSSVNQSSDPLNSGMQFFRQENSSPTFGGQLTANRLLKAGRGSYNFTVTGNYNSSDINYLNRSLTNYSTAGHEEQIAFDQESDQENNRSYVNGSLSHVRLLNKEKKVSLTLKDTYQYVEDMADKVTLEYNPLSGSYELLVPDLSNNFRNHTWRNTGSVGINAVGKTIVYNVNAAIAYLGLSGKTIQNPMTDIRRSTVAFVPDASLSYRQANGKSLYFGMSSSVTMPDVSSLQPVLNNTNPLYIRNGNPDLEMARSFNANLNYSNFDFKNNRYINVYSSFSQTWNGFSTQSIVDPDSRIQTVTPVNTDGNYSFNIGLSSGKPTKIKGLRYSFHSRLNHNRNINYINTSENRVNRITANLGGSVNYAADRFAVDLDLGSNYNSVNNSVQNLSNQKYFNFDNFIRISGEPVKTFRIFTDLNQILYTGGGSGGRNTNFTLMNAGIEKFFMKDRQLTLSLAAFDLLNQNSNIRRSISATGRIEDFRTNELNRYFYLKLTYKLRRMGAGPQTGPIVIR